MEITRGKIAAVAIAMVYLAIAIAMGGWDPGGIAALCLSLSLPLALIWFPDAIGAMTGPVARGGRIDKESPPPLVSLMGWIILGGLSVIAYLLSR